MITVKEEFLGSIKTQRAIEIGGSDAVVLWLALKGYVSAGNTGGFVPEEAIPKLGGVPKRWGRVMEALLACGKLRPDGTRGNGLVERVPHGFQLHDYEDHGTPVEVEDDRRRKAREQKRRKRAELASKSGHPPPDSPRTRSGQGPDSPADNGTGQPPDSPPPARVPAPVGARGIPSHPIPAQPIPPPDTAAAAAPERPPSSLDAAMDLPLADRANWCVQREDVAGWIEPKLWPEVIRAAAELGAAVGVLDVRLGSYQRDSGLRAVVELFAAGYTPEDLSRAAKAATGSAYFSNKRSLAAFTIEVVRRLLADAGAGADAYTVDEQTGVML